MLKRAVRKVLKVLVDRGDFDNIQEAWTVHREDFIELDNLITIHPEDAEEFFTDTFSLEIDFFEEILFASI